MTPEELTWAEIDDRATELEALAADLLVQTIKLRQEIQRRRTLHQEIQRMETGGFS